MKLSDGTMKITKNRCVVNNDYLAGSGWGTVLIGLYLYEYFFSLTLKDAILAPIRVSPAIANGIT